MRAIPTAVFALAALIASPLAAFAQTTMTQNERFCSIEKTNTGAEAPPRCAHRTMQQCQETVKGDQGTCIENPNLER